MKFNIELDTNVEENGDVSIKAIATIIGTTKRSRVAHTIKSYELHRSYDQKKLIDDTESRVVTAAMASAKAKK